MKEFTNVFTAPDEEFLKQDDDPTIVPKFDSKS